MALRAFFVLEEEIFKKYVIFFQASLDKTLFLGPTISNHSHSKPEPFDILGKADASTCHHHLIRLLGDC